MTTDEGNMWACELNNLSPTDNDVMWVYTNHGFICSTAVVKERVLVSFANQVDETFAFWAMQDIPKVKKFKLTSEAEQELASVAVALQLMSRKFSSKFLYTMSIIAHVSWREDLSEYTVTPYHTTECIV